MPSAWRLDVGNVGSRVASAIERTIELLMIWGRSITEDSTSFGRRWSETRPTIISLPRRFITVSDASAAGSRVGGVKRCTARSSSNATSLCQVGGSVKMTGSIAIRLHYQGSLALLSFGLGLVPSGERRSMSKPSSMFQPRWA